MINYFQKLNIMISFGYDKLNLHDCGYDTMFIHQLMNSWRWNDVNFILLSNEKLQIIIFKLKDFM